MKNTLKKYLDEETGMNIGNKSEIRHYVDNMDKASRFLYAVVQKENSKGEIEDGVYRKLKKQFQDSSNLVNFLREYMGYNKK